MNQREAEILSRLIDGEIQSACDLDRETSDALDDFARNGWIKSWLDGTFEINPSAIDALEEYREAAVQKASELELRTTAAEAIKKLSNELERTRQEFSDYKAQQKHQYESDRAQRVLDDKKRYAREFILSALSIALTLIIEHFNDVLKFFNFLFKVAPH